MALCLPSSATFVRLCDLYGDSKEETIYTPDGKDSSLSDKYTLQRKNTFLALPPEMLLGVEVAGPSLIYLLG